jgi:hypothetical protein
VVFSGGSLKWKTVSCGGSGGPWIIACIGILAYGIIEEPKYLIMLSIALLASVVAISGIAMDRRRAIAMETGTAIDSEAGVVAKP